ncbi:agouti-signaling protein 2b isoform X2 [Maylandia zebra]|uniref:agouti-signaling protein 2b isoform X2 n=1 Tax=Maylandia zebra TaxID=106582 RepID=UPI00403C73F6
MHRAHHVASACFSPRSQTTSSFTAREKPEGTNQPRHLIIIMRKITGKHLLCFFLLALPMSWAEDTKKDVRKRENVTVWSQAKNRRLFARQKISPPRQSVTPHVFYPDFLLSPQPVAADGPYLSLVLPEVSSC